MQANANVPASLPGCPTTMGRPRVYRVPVFCHVYPENSHSTLFVFSITEMTWNTRHTHAQKRGVRVNLSSHQHTQTPLSSNCLHLYISECTHSCFIYSPKNSTYDHPTVSWLSEHRFTKGTIIVTAFTVSLQDKIGHSYNQASWQFPTYNNYGRGAG